MRTRKLYRQTLQYCYQHLDTQAKKACDMYIKSVHEPKVKAPGLDGHTRKFSIDELTPGMVLRYIQSDGSTPPFMDAVVTNILSDSVEFARVHASGIERLTLWKNIDPSNYHWQLVLLASGKPYTVSLNFNLIGRM